MLTKGMAVKQRLLSINLPITGVVLIAGNLSAISVSRELTEQEITALITSEGFTPKIIISETI